MTTTHTGRHRWLVSEDSAGVFPLDTGTASTAEQAWDAALTAGHAALLAGEILYLAIAVDDEIPTFTYSPRRDCDGQLDPIYLAQDFDELRAAGEGGCAPDSW